MLIEAAATATVGGLALLPSVWPLDEPRRSICFCPLPLIVAPKIESELPRNAATPSPVLLVTVTGLRPVSGTPKAIELSSIAKSSIFKRASDWPTPFPVMVLLSMLMAEVSLA